MEKNIRKRVCRGALVLSAGLVVLFGYWFFLKPTHTEIEYNKMYPAFGKPTDKEFED